MMARPLRLLLCWLCLLAPVAGQAETLGVESVVSEALAHNPDLQLARASAARGRADALVSFQRPNPRFAITPDTVISAAAGGSPWTLTTGLLMQLLRPGEARARRARLQADTQAIDLDLADTLWRTRTTAVSAFRAAVIARAAEAAARDLAAVEMERLASGQRLLAAGQLGRAEQTLLAEAEARARAEVPARAAARQAAEAALAQALGRPLAQVSAAALDWSSGTTPPPVPAVPAEQALFNRLDIQAALARFRSADAAWRQAVSGRRGIINAGPGYTYDRGNQRISFTLDVEAPLYHGPRARLAAAQAARAEAQAGVERLQTLAGLAANSSAADYGRRLAEFRTQADIVAAASAEAARAQRALSAGAGDRTAVLDAAARRATATLNRLDALARLASAAAAFEAATQRPFWPEEPT